MAGVRNVDMQSECETSLTTRCAASVSRAAGCGATAAAAAVWHCMDSIDLDSIDVNSIHAATSGRFGSRD